MKKILLYCLPLCLLFASCSDLLDEESYSETGKDNYLNNAKEAETVLQGVYKNLANEYTYSYHLSLLFTISTDIAQCEGSSTTSFREIPTNSHNASTSQISRTWQKLYSAIYDANDFIETVSGRMDNWGSSDRELATIYLGEARALRALFYFELVRWYGNVVLMTSTADSRRKDETFEQTAAKGRGREGRPPRRGVGQAPSDLRLRNRLEEHLQRYLGCGRKPDRSVVLLADGPRQRQHGRTYRQMERCVGYHGRGRARTQCRQLESDL